LVTGATGFVGGHLVDRLLATGATVTAIIRDPKKAADLGRRGVNLVVGDLANQGALASACRDQQMIYHVAGAIAARDEAEFLAVNRDGTARLLEAAQANGVGRFVLVSSLSVGGPTRPDSPLAGSEAANPVTAYGRSKLAGEVEVARSRLAWTIVRPPVVYGPGDREMLRVFRAAAFGIAPVFGDGSQQLSLVYGPDLAAALVAAGTSTATVGGVYYAAHPERLTTRQMVATLGAAIGKRPWVVPIPGSVARPLLALTEGIARLGDRPTVLTRDKGHELLQSAWVCDPTRLTTATGWRAEFTLEAGGRQTYDWYRRHRWL
jgi:nucleoside-diphosphate-sugar epimerase